MSDSLKPCPLCSQPLTVYGGRNNPYAKCETKGCWLADRAIAVVMDEPRQVAAWNTRAPIPVTDEMVERAARTHCDYYGGLGWYDSGRAFDSYDNMRDAMRAALTAALGGTK